jgi:hypothetical protein
LHWLAYRAHVELQSPRCGGIAAAVAWVRGGRVGPVTERDESPVTRSLATAEMWAASAAGAPDLPRPPLEELCDKFGVAYWAPRPILPEWGEGAWRALRWLLGRSYSAGLSGGW